MLLHDFLDDAGRFHVFLRLVMYLSCSQQSLLGLLRISQFDLTLRDENQIAFPETGIYFLSPHEIGQCALVACRRQRPKNKVGSITAELFVTHNTSYDV